MAHQHATRQARQQVRDRGPVVDDGGGAGVGGAQHGPLELQRAHAADGQVLVMHDMLGLDSGHRRPKFVKDFLAEGGSVAGAVQAYAQAVRDGSFPDAEHAYAA